MRKIKLGVWGDAVTPTGFSRVLHSIIGKLPKRDYNIFWVGVNYNGDPHDYRDLKIYPANPRDRSDPYGFQRIKDILMIEKPDILFILNDAWVINKCLLALKDIYTTGKFPKIVTYIPVDALDHDPDWYKNFDIVNKVVAYTEFGKHVISKALPDRDIDIIYHGVDNSIFYKINDTKENIKRQCYPDNESFYKDSFIVLNASRNQPRKRLDLTLQGFSLFAKDKPENVKLYMHCGIVDSHMHITKLADRYGISHRLIVTNRKVGVQTVPDKTLNLIYNSCDVGINTSIGEGWCLPCIEHAVTGAPQVVPGHSALLELYKDCGMIMPVSSTHVIDGIMTTGYLVNPLTIAEKLEKLYQNKDLYNDLSQKSLAKFTSDVYSWFNIAMQWDKLFKDLIK